MLQTNPNGDYPQVDPSAFIHETAVVLGKVRVGKRVYIGPYAVIRADEPGPDGVVQPVVIGDGANIQDGSTIHSLAGSSVIFGANSSLAHGALLHGPAEIGENCFVGFRSVVFKAILGPGVVVLHQALVDGVAIAAHTCVPSHACITTPALAARLSAVTEAHLAFARKVVGVNQWLAAASQPRARLNRPKARTAACAGRR